MDEFTRLVRGAFDEPLMAHGFAAGQGGLGADSGMVMFCMSCDDFAERFGGTPMARDFVNDGSCIDFVVDAVRTDRWHAVGVRCNWYLSTPDLPRESLEAEVEYLAARTLPMLDGISAVEWAAPGWQPEFPPSALLPRSSINRGPKPSAVLRRVGWSPSGRFTTRPQ